MTRRNWGALFIFLAVLVALLGLFLWLIYPYIPRSKW